MSVVRYRTPRARMPYGVLGLLNNPDFRRLALSASRGVARRTGSSSRPSARATGMLRSSTFSRSRRSTPYSRPSKKARSAPPSRSGISTGVVQNEGVGGQCSYFTGVRGKSWLPPHVLDALAPHHVQYNRASQLVSTTGTQNFDTVVQLGAPSLLHNAVAGDEISRGVYCDERADITINNREIGNAYVIIYDIYARKDINTEDIAWPHLAWKQGVADEGSAGSWTDLGSTPWMSEVFNQYYAVSQVTNIVLGGGQTHLHKVKHYSNRLISDAYASRLINGIQDLTYFCMIEVHGPPANGSTGDLNDVSIGRGVLNIVVDRTSVLKFIEDKKPVIDFTNNLATTFAGAEQTTAVGGTTIVTDTE